MDRALSRLVGKAVGEIVLGLLGAALLAAVTAGAHLAWARAPALTTAGALLAGLNLVAAVVVTVRESRCGRRNRRGRVAVAVLVLLGILAGFAVSPQ